MDFELYGENMDVLEPILQKGDVTIYESDIEYTINEYRSKLDNPDLIYKSSCFQGLLEYIYKRYLKDIIRQDNNFYYDYVVLDTIYYNIYVPLCNRFNMCNTLIAFCCNLCHIDSSFINDIKKGYYRDGSKVNNDIVRMVRQWDKFSESSLVNKTVNENSVGSIFTLKSLYNYSDNQPQVVSITTSQSHQTVDEIRQKYASAFLPDQKELSDNLDSIEFGDNDE